MPTYRTDPSDHTKVEGVDFSNNIFHFSDYDGNEIGEYLSKNNIGLFIKLHPFEEMSYDLDNLKLPKNSYLIKSADLSNKNLTTYDIIGAFDLLITDYSSIYFDYLILDKPIIFINSDKEKYEKSRGFVFDNFDFWTPGPKLKTQKELILELNNYENIDNYYKDERKIINSLSNKYLDDNSCERVYKMMKKI